MHIPRNFLTLDHVLIEFSRFWASLRVAILLSAKQVYLSPKINNHYITLFLFNVFKTFFTQEDQEPKIIELN